MESNGKNREKEQSVQDNDSSGKEEHPRLHRHTLIEMNASVFTARREAAHRCVLKLLRRDNLPISKEDRRTLYAYCVHLLGHAVESTERSQIERDTAVLHYLQLLRDTIAANLALVRHELKLNREKEALAKLANEEAVINQLQTTDSVFSDSEMNILECVENLLDFGKSIILQENQDRWANFTDDEKRRYNLALKEHEEYYDRTPAQVKEFIETLHENEHDTLTPYV